MNTYPSHSAHKIPTVGSATSDPSPVEYLDRIATAAEHCRLFDAVGWPRYENSELASALAGSLAGTIAASNGVVIAMGRVVGDGGKFFYLQDVVVAPSRQGEGIGRELTRRLITQVQGLAPGSPFIGVFATPEAITLYQRLGFTHDFGDLIGMARISVNARVTSIVEASPYAIRPV